MNRKQPIGKQRAPSPLPELDAVLGGDEPVTPAASFEQEPEPAAAGGASTEPITDLEPEAGSADEFDGEDGREHPDLQDSGTELTPVAIVPDEPDSARGLGTAGLGLVLAGVGQMIWLATAPAGAAGVGELLARIGATPGAVIVLGTLLALASAMRRRHSAFEQRLHGMQELFDASNERSAAHLQQLVEGRSAQPPAEGEELRSVLLALHKQDEKTNNLTRAIKMYGKPLIEITNLVTEISTRSGELGTQLESLRLVLEKNQSKLQETLKSELQRPQDHGVARPLAEVQNALAKSNLLMQQLHTEVKAEIEGQRERATRVEAAVQAEQKQIAELTAKVAQLAPALAESRKQFATGIEQVLGQRSSAPDAGIDAMLKDIQEAVAGLTTSVTRLQAPEPRQAAAPRPAPAPAPVPVAAAAPAAAAAATTAPEPARETTPGTEGPGGLAQSIAGSHKDGGSSFLQSIAKLKKLRKD